MQFSMKSLLAAALMVASVNAAPVHTDNVAPAVRRDPADGVAWSGESTHLGPDQPVSLQREGCSDHVS
jgi:hypothetical protein